MHNALLRLEDGKGGRLVPVKDFYLGPGKVDLRQGEVLTYVIIPAKEYQGHLFAGRAVHQYGADISKSAHLKGQ